MWTKFVNWLKRVFKWGVNLAVTEIENVIAKDTTHLTKTDIELIDKALEIIRNKLCNKGK